METVRGEPSLDRIEGLSVSTTLTSDSNDEKEPAIGRARERAFQAESTGHVKPLRWGRAGVVKDHREGQGGRNRIGELLPRGG